MSQARPSELLFGSPKFCFEPARVSRALTQMGPATFSPPEVIENELAKSLSEWPPTSISKVAARLRCDDGRMRRLFPEMCAQLVQQGREYKAVKAKAHRAQLVEKVKQAVYTIHSQGFVPSAKRVNKYMHYRISSPVLRAAFVEARADIGLPVPEK